MVCNVQNTNTVGAESKDVGNVILGQSYVFDGEDGRRSLCDCVSCQTWVILCLYHTQLSFFWAAACQRGCAWYITQSFGLTNVSIGHCSKRAFVVNVSIWHAHYKFLWKSGGRGTLLAIWLPQDRSDRHYIKSSGYFCDNCASDWEVDC